MIWVLGASVALNVLLFVGAWRLFDENDSLENQCDNLNDLLCEEIKDNVALQSLLKQYYEIFEQYDYEDTTPTIIIDEDWD